MSVVMRDAFTVTTGRNPQQTLMAFSGFLTPKLLWGFEDEGDASVVSPAGGAI